MGVENKYRILSLLACFIFVIIPANYMIYGWAQGIASCLAEAALILFLYPIIVLLNHIFIGFLISHRIAFLMDLMLLVTCIIMGLGRICAEKIFEWMF